MQMQYLAATLGHHAIAGPTLLRPDGHYGNALLTRRPVLDVRHVDLTVYRREPRAALDVDLDIDGVAVRVVVTHLGLLPGERRTQVRRLLDQLGESRADVVIVCGDINEWFAIGRPLRWLHARLGRTAGVATFPAVFPVFALDRIWVNPRGGADGAGRARQPVGAPGLRSPAGDWRTSGCDRALGVAMRCAMRDRMSLRARWWRPASPSSCWAPRVARAPSKPPRSKPIPGSATTRRCTSRPAPRWRWSGTRARRWRPTTGPPGSSSRRPFALGLGIAKEVWDLSGHGDASWRDLTWDVVGTTTGVLVAYAIDWAIGRLRGPSTNPVRRSGYGSMTAMDDSAG